MTMTPDQARTKRCHRESRVVAYGILTRFLAILTRKPSANDADEVFAQTRCQADDCMAWRWHLSQKRIAVATPQGYCGLAGAQGLD